MQTWLSSLSRSARGRKTTRNSRQARPARRSKFDGMEFRVERLEDRMLLAADLTLAYMSLPPANVSPGELVTYTLLAGNGATGTSSATGVTVTDNLPLGETFVDASITGAGANVNNFGNTVTANLGTLAVNQTDTITIQALVTTTTATTKLTNTASMVNTSSDINPINLLPPPQGSPPSSTVTALPATGTVDLSVTKTAGTNPAVVGSDEVYTIVVTNNEAAGGTQATGVTLLDTLPTNATFKSASDGNAGTITPPPAGSNLLTDSIGNLNPGQTDTIKVTVTPTAGGPLVNTATVTGNQPDPDTDNNIAVNAIAAGSGTTNATVDLSVTKVPTTNPGTVGSVLTFQMVVTNNSMTNATGVSLVDQLPTEASGYSSNPGTVIGNVLTAPIGNLAAGKSATVTVSLTPTASGVLTNTASVASDQVDSNPANNVAVSTIPVGGSITNATVDLSITKTPASNPATVGFTEIYTIVVANNSATNATGVNMVDTLPTNANAYKSSAGTITDNVLVDPIGNLAANASVTVSVTVTPTATGSLINTASVASDQVDSNLANNAVTTNTPVVTPPNLAITKTGPANAKVGTPLTYTIIVTNTGGTAATGATVTDVLPAGLIDISATDLAGTVVVKGNTVTDTLGTLAATNGKEQITITATPNLSLSGQSVTNTATLNYSATSTTATSSAVTAIAFQPVVYLAGTPGDGTVPTGVTNLYHELLGRAPDAQGLQTWVAFGQANMNAFGDQIVVSGFMNSYEYKAHYVSSIYEVFLGRAPDANGLAFWTSLMGSPGTPGGHGGSADEKFVLSAILGSDEYYNDAGGTPQGWINSLYEDLLGRAADGGGMQFWQNELATRGAGDRDGIVRDLLTTPEAAHDLLDAYYPNVGGTAAAPLPPNGDLAGVDGTKLAEITGGGWENLYLQGPYDSQQQANDQFFNELAGGTSWDDVQYQILTTQQYYSNPNRPVLANNGIQGP
jgi:uncharacterized repeat protein (TIGR01451 family)